MLMDELAIAKRIILRKILGRIKEGDQYRRRHNNELYKHIEKITDTIRKWRIAFYGHLQRMNSYRLTGRIFKYIRKLKMDVHGSVKRKMLLRNFRLHRKTSQSILHSGTSYIILKVSNKNWEEKQELFGLRKGEKNTRKEWDRDMEGKKKGKKEAVETNIVHSGLFDTKNNKKK